MLEQKSYLKVLKRLVPLSLILPILLLSSGCSYFKNPLKTIEIKTVEVERVIPIQNRPKPMSMNNIHFYVVTEDTFEDFKKRFLEENGDFLFYTLSVRDYETLALNMADIKRYILQQKELIIYYEKAVAPKPTEEEKDEK
jgi:hypothetical protein